MQAAYQVAQVNLEKAEWSLAKTRVHAASDGYITNLQTRIGNYASAGVTLVALVDTNSFYVHGYFKETKLGHIDVEDHLVLQGFVRRFLVSGREQR